MGINNSFSNCVKTSKHVFTKPYRAKLLMLALLPAVAILDLPAHASTWNGNASPDASWSNAANWDSLPTSGSPLIFDGSLQLTNNNDIAAGTVFGGITFNGSAGAFILTGNALDPGGDITDNAGANETINLALTFSTDRNIVVAGGPLAIGGILSDGGAGFGFTLSGGGGLTLSAANTYSGKTAINAGTLVLSSGATLGNGSSALSLGNTTTATTGNLDLTSASATVASLTSSTNTTTSNNITVGTGRSLNISGNVLVGGLSSTSAHTLLTIAGTTPTDGTLAVGNGSGKFIVSNIANANSGATTAVLDLHALNTFTANYGSSGIIGIGAGVNGTGDNAPFGSLILANSNTLTAGTLNIGINTGGGNASSSSLVLGTTNTINVDKIVVGVGKNGSSTTPNTGCISFQTGLSNPTLILRGSDGTSRVGNLTISDGSQYTTAGSSAQTGLVDLSAGSVDALIDSLAIAVGTNTLSNTGGSNGSLILGAGTMDVNAIVVGTRAISTAVANTSGCLTLSGPATLTVNTGIKLADTSTGTTTGTTKGALNVNGGTLNTSGDIIGGGGNSTVLLNGGTLNLNNHNLGTAASPLTTRTFQSGTLSNVAEINGGNVGLTKTTAGTLNITGVNTYTGNTTSAGILNVTGSITAAGNVTVASTATLSGSGNGSTTGIVGNVIMANGSTLSPGATIGAAGTLTAANLTVNGGAFIIDLGTGVGSNDLIHVNGAATFAGAATFNVGAAATAGVYTLLNTTGALTLTVTPTLTDLDPNFQYILDTTSNAHAILLNVNSLGAALTWNGAADLTTWDFSKQNFTNGNNNQAFAGNSPVTFDDSAPASATTINITAAVSPATIAINSNSNNFTFTGPNGITGASVLNLNGSSTLTIANLNTFTGDTNLNNGTLAISATGAIASGNITIAPSGTLTIAAGGSISATTNFTDNGIATLNNPNRTIATLNGGGILNLNSTNLSVTGGGNFTGTLQGTGGLTVSGGTLTLSANNAYFAPTTLNGGTLSISSDANLGDPSSPLTFGGGTLLITGTSDTITNRTITLNAGGGSFNINDATNIFTIPNAISGPDALTKSGGGTLVLSTASSYLGGTSINAGTLQVSDDSFLGNPAGPLTFKGGTLFISGTTFNTTSRAISLAAGIGTFNISDPGNTFTINTVLSGPGGPGKAGPGALVLGGNNNYTGNTTLANGNTTLSNGATLGSNSNLTLGANSAATAANLDLSNASISIASLTASSNTTTPDVIAIGAGKTLTITGNVLIGAIVANNSNTIVNVTGGSIIAGSGNGGLFIVGNQGNNNSTTANGTLDLSLSQGLTANYGPTGIIGIGTNNAGLSGNATYGTLLLGNVNTLTAGTLNIGINNGGANTSSSSLLLGVTNTLNVDTITVGVGKGAGTTGSISFQSGLTNPSLKIRAADGVSRTGNFVIADGSQYNASSPTATTSSVDLSGGSVDALINNLTLAVGKALINSGPSNATLTFDTGTIDATNITIAIQGTSVSAGATATGTINVNGSANLVAGAGGIILASVPAIPHAAATITGTLNINGGNVTSAGDIIDGGGASTLNLAGGALDLTGHNLGSAASPIDTLNLQTGTLKNVAEINGGATLEKNTSGTLTLAGVNTYSGATSIDAGQLNLAGSITSPNVSVASGANLTVLSGGKLGTHSTLTVNGSVIIASATPRTLTTLSALSIAGSYGGSASAVSSYTGTLDLTNSKLIVEDSSGTLAADLAQIKNEALASNTSGGTLGIVSSSANATNAAAGKIVKVIAVSDNAVRMATFPAGSTNFGGTNNVDAGSILVMSAFKGDANLDGVVDIQDLTAVANHWQQTVTDWSQGDFDGSNFVDIQDLTAVANNWQAGVGAGSGQSFSDALTQIGAFGHTAATPEPASLAILGLSGLVLAARRRRSR